MPKRIFIPAGGPATITGTGALQSGSATVAGTGSVTAATTAIAITEPIAHRIFQRTASTQNAVVTFAGTYTGSAPSSIQVKVTKHATPATVVLDWTALGSFSASAGVWSGTATVPQGTASAITYNTEARVGTSTPTDSSANEWGVGILVAHLGQSNASNQFDQGSGTAASGLKRHSGAVASSNAGTWSDMATTGGGAIALGNAIISAIGVPVGLFDYGVSASAITTWLSAGTNYLNFKYGVTQNGGALEFIYWNQGETEAAAGVSQATYEGQLYTDANSVIKNCRADFTNASDQTNLPFLVALIGRNSNKTDANVAAIRAAQIAICGTAADTHIAHTSEDLDLETDGIHYKFTGSLGIVAAGNRTAQTILYVLGEQTYHRGPFISACSIVNATTIDVTITHRGGADFTPSSEIVGFEIISDATPLTPSAASRQSATVIRLTSPSELGEALSVRYLYGTDGGVSPFSNTMANAVRDDSALALPLEGSAGFALVPNHAASGALSAQAATIAGTGAVSSAGTVTGTGALAADSATMAGTAERVLTGTGTLAAGAPALAGTATLEGAPTGAGAIQCGTATMNGVAIRTVNGSGALASSDATIAGTAAIPGATTLTPADIAAIVAAIKADPLILTVPKFLALK